MLLKQRFRMRKNYLRIKILEYREYEKEDIINIAWGDAVGGYGATQLG